MLNVLHTFKDDAIDVVPVAFLDVFFGPGNVPSINLANVRGPFYCGALWS